MLKFILSTGLLLSAAFSVTAQRELNNPLINSKEVITKAVALHDARKYKEAITEYLKVPVSDSNYAQVLMEMVYSYYADSNFVAAEKQVNIGLELFPAKKQALLRYLADIYDDSKRSGQALAVYDTIIKMNPYDYLSYFNKAICLYRQEKNDEAAVNFKKTIMLNPYYSSAHYFLGLISLQKGNLAEAMMSFTANLLVSPGNKYYQKSINFLSAISEVNTNITGYLKNYKPGKEDDFETLQDIITSKIALDKNYKLKVGLEDKIVRQLQVLFEKAEFNTADNGFWMQYYVPVFKKVWNDNKFEPFIFYIFSELNIDKVKAYNKKEKKEIEKISVDLIKYFNAVRKSQEINYAKRESAKFKYYVSNYQVTGKGEFALNEKNEEILVGPWEFYYTTGALKSKGTFDDKGLRTGAWNYYYEDGTLKETSVFNLDKASGKSEIWHENGLRYKLANYKDDEPDGTEYVYFFNGQPRSEIMYRNGKREGPARYFSVKGILYSANTYVNDLQEGEEKVYYESGKLFSTGSYRKDEPDGEYKEFHENGKLLKSGNYIDGKRSGNWQSFYENGKTEYTAVYVNGKLEGEYITFYENGKTSNRAFYRKGEVDGKEENFDEDGLIFCETIYEKGRLRDIKFFDKKGNVISNTTSRKGNADIIFYRPDGSKNREGYFSKEGLREGKSFFYYKNGKILTEAIYKNGLLNGKKTTYYANGKLQEEGIYTDDEPDGYFVTYYNNGTVSEEGWYVKGKKQGTFLLYNSLGQLTNKAYYQDDKIHGVNEFYHPGGKANYTEYYDNAWFKKVVQFDTLGAKLTVSELVKGEGKVLFKHYNGKPYFESHYKNYRLHGMYKVTNADGSLHSIRYYKYGNIDSNYTAWHSNGKIRLEAAYDKGMRTGEWKYYLRNGKQLETELYVDGKLDGINKQYNENSTLDKEYEFKKGDLNGAIKYYAENNQLAAVLYYNMDELTGYSYEDKNGNLVPVIPLTYGTGKVTAYFKNGNKSVDLQFNESIVDGDRNLFYTNGKPYVTGKRINGLDNGIKKVFYPDGKLMKEENYLNGNLHGNARHYAENGTLIYDLNYYNDELHGICKYYEAGKLTETATYFFSMLEEKN